MDDDASIGDLLDDGDDAEDELSTSPPEQNLEVIEANRSCSDCAKRDVCAVYGNIKPQVEGEIPQRTGGEPAFEADDLAKICELYDPVE